MRAMVVFLVIGVVCMGVPSKGLAQEGAIAVKIISYAKYVVEVGVVAAESHNLWMWIKEHFAGQKPPLTAEEENALGVKFLTGDGVPVNKKEAYNHFVRASSANMYAKVNIAVMYMNGDMAAIESREVGDQDWNLAAKILRPVIDQTRNPVAEYNFGVGAEHFGYLDYAIYWYNDANSRGYPRPSAKNAVSRLCRNATFSSLDGTRAYRLFPSGPIISKESWNKYC